jgi:hypothetical protein
MCSALPWRTFATAVRLSFRLVHARRKSADRGVETVEARQRSLRVEEATRVAPWQTILQRSGNVHDFQRKRPKHDFVRVSGIPSWTAMATERKVGYLFWVDESLSVQALEGVWRQSLWYSPSND